MEDSPLTKDALRLTVAKRLEGMPPETLARKYAQIESRLFDFANFLEANIVLLYMGSAPEITTRTMLTKSLEYRKVLILPAFRAERHEVLLMRVTNPAQDLRPGPRGVLEPNPERCKQVPPDCLDIAIIPGVVFDEKGGRIGTGKGYYDRFIPRLPTTTRKVSLATEEQVFPQVPMESHDQHVDIIITENRTIYKI
jgi:5-formyltetrahydrofolate cyclo-ligase